MKQTLTFIPPVVDSTQSSIHTEAYEKSVDLYNQGDYLQAFHSLLDYLNADFRTKYGNADGTEFHIPHGSIPVHISVKDGFYPYQCRLPELARERACSHASTDCRPESEQAAVASLCEGQR